MQTHSLAIALILATALPAAAQTSSFSFPSLGAKGQAQPGSTPAPATPVQAKIPAGTPPGNIVAENPQGIVDVIREMGYRAELGTDNQGDPVVRSRVSGIDYSIYFYGCTNGTACTTIQFSAGFDLNDGTTYEVMNDWNMKKRFAKAYVDEEMDPYLQMDMNLEFGGVTVATFKDSVDLWERLVGDFKTQINW